MSRWKGKGAQQVASAKPLSGLNEEIKAWEAPLQCTLVACGGIVKVNAEQLRVLAAAGFGSKAPSDMGILPGTFVTGKFQIENVDSQGCNEVPFLRFLTLEEVFYLSYELRCLHIYRQSSKGPVQLTHEEAWCLMRDYKSDFVKLYKAYSHLRRKRWVVGPGSQYGADFMAYRHHPALVHSDYAVVVMLEEEQARMNRWTDVQGMARLCGSVAKTLLLLYITFNGDSVDYSSPRCLEDLSVEEVEVRRWLPEKHREDSL